jgi:MFS family permease
VRPSRFAVSVAATRASDDHQICIGATEFGILSASLGIGAILATPLIAGPGSGMLRSRLIGAGLIVYGCALMGFALAPNYWFGAAALMAAGGGYLAIASTLNTTIQLQVAENMRGKVLAVYVMGLTGSAPIGALVQGWAADVIGPRLTVVIAGVVFFLLALALRSTGRLRDVDAEGEEPLGAKPAGAAPSAPR